MSLYANADQISIDNYYEPGMEVYISNHFSTVMTQRISLVNIDNTIFESEPGLLRSQVELTLKRLKMNKATGNDCIAVDVLNKYFDV